MKIILIPFLFLSVYGFSQTSLDKAKEVLDKKNHAEAIVLLENFIKENPTNVKALEYLGDAYFGEQQWDDAKDAYDKARKLEPNNADLHFKFGASLGKKALIVNKLKALRLIGPMENAFLKSLEIEPNHVFSHFALARYYMHVPGFLGGSKAKARNHVDTVLKLSLFEGTIAEAHFYEDNNDFTTAEKLYKKAILMKKNTMSYQHLIDLYIKQSDYKKAVLVLEEAYQNLQEKTFKKQLEKLKEKL